MKKELHRWMGNLLVYQGNCVSYCLKAFRGVGIPGDLDPGMERYSLKYVVECGSLLYTVKDAALVRYSYMSYGGFVFAVFKRCKLF